MIESHKELYAYVKAKSAAKKVFELSKSFPAEERYSLTSQCRRSSRSVCANLAEAWRKRRYEAAFISKLSDAEAEAAETQAWLEFAVDCGYATLDQTHDINQLVEESLRLIVGMIANPEPWLIGRP